MDFDENKENGHRKMTPEVALRRKVRYRSLLNRLEVVQKGEDLGLKTANELGSVLTEANDMQSEYKIESRVEQIEETIMDCLVVSISSTILKKCVEAVDTSTSTYEHGEFAEWLVKHLRDNRGRNLKEQDLLKLLGDARDIVPSVPSYKQVYGSYDINENMPIPKPKRQHQRVAQEQVQKKVPEMVVNVNKDEERIEEIVQVMYRVLTVKYNENNKEPIKYYDYVLDTDYGATVENAFYVSFLIRDGKARIDLTGRGEPIIAPVDRNELKTFRAEGKINTQVANSINMREWHKIRKEGYLQQYKKYQQH